MRLRLCFILFMSCLISAALFAQQDTAQSKFSTTPLFKDTSNVLLKDNTAARVITDTTGIKKKPKHDPHKATFRSAVLPGWGQAYNHEYWKIPIVYGVLAIPASLYFYNNSYYKKMKFGYEALYAAKYLGDSSLLSQVSPKVKDPQGNVFDLATYQSYRNSFKRNKDYSLLYFIVLWGINVADATVFGNLKDFDVSDDLTLQINPTYFPSTKTKGVSLVFNFKNKEHKTAPVF